MFSRAALEPGTPTYDAAYARKPGWKEVDDAIRRLPRLTEPGGTFFDAPIMAQTADLFAELERLRVDPEWLELQSVQLRAAPEASSHLTRVALRLGAVAAGCGSAASRHRCRPGSAHRGRSAGGKGDVPNIPNLTTRLV